MIRTGTLLAAALLGAALAPRAAAQMSAADSVLLKRADHARIEGSPTATVWLVEMSDFQCPFCKRWHDETYPTIKKEYLDTGKIRIAYFNFPLSMHRNSHKAARVAMCAAAQDLFWPMHEALFGSQGAWKDLADPAPVFDSLAKQAGVALPALHACLAGSAIDKMIVADSERAASLGVRSTPSFSISGSPQLIEGALPLEVFKKALDGALAAPGKP
jgi:protein-disulfide isomerase